jgi:TetR/AcrR family transcriptional regulator
MNEIKKDNTEEKILNAAQEVFIQKGMDGSRMQEIADHAGINKALLHYYFRTKQKLFEAIFKKVFKHVFPKIEMLILSDKPLEEKLGTFIEKYIDVLIMNPYLPTFIIKEMHRDPDFLSSVMKSQGIHPEKIINVFEKEMEAGKIRKMNPKDLMINVLGLCIFPFATKPLMKIMFFENDKKKYNQFLQNRKTTVKEFVLNSIIIGRK